MSPEQQTRINKARSRESQRDKLLTNRDRVRTLLANLEKASMPGRDEEGMDVYIANLLSTVTFIIDLRCKEQLRALRDDGVDAKAEAIELYHLGESNKNWQQIESRLRQMASSGAMQFSYDVDDWFRRGLPKELLGDLLPSENTDSVVQPTLARFAQALRDWADYTRDQAGPLLSEIQQRERWKHTGDTAAQELELAKLYEKKRLYEEWTAR